MKQKDWDSMSPENEERNMIIGRAIATTIIVLGINFVLGCMFSWIAGFWAVMKVTGMITLVILAICYCSLDKYESQKIIDFVTSLFKLSKED